jgi:threonine aldolase
MSVDLDRVHTNIVMIDIDGAAELERRARERGVLSVAIGQRRLRLVTHLDLDRAACSRAVEVFAALTATG